MTQVMNVSIRKILSGTEEKQTILPLSAKKTGKVVWSLGPDYTATKEERRIGQIIGQHHVHMIPKGLPGEGNILIFDNGGWSGYGVPSNTSRDGTKVNIMDRSPVIELDPITKKLFGN